MIKELKAMAAGTEVKGFPLLIKTARKAFSDGDSVAWQEVVFMDASGEMLGHIYLGDGVIKEGHHAGPATFPLWKSKERVCILQAEIQDTDERKREDTKLVVTECFNMAVNLTHDQIQDLQEEEWKKLREDEIKGKIRHGLVCADKAAGKIPDKVDILAWQDFIMTGE